MALTAEHNATLQLLLERGQSYPDLAKLLGVEEPEVRGRARAALTELAGADPDRNVALTDYLLGQADPIGRADAVRHLRDDPDDLRLAQELVETLRASYPNAELPRLPGEARPPRRRPVAGGEARGFSLPSLSTSQARLAGILGAGAVILIAAVLAIAGVFSGDDDEPASSAETTAANGETTGAGEEIERVSLSSPSGGDATGEALFGLTDDDQPFLDLTIDGLDPAPNDQTYVVWLLLDEKQGYPLTPLAVSENGSFQDRYAIPSAVLPIVARVRFVNISIAPVDEVRKTVRAALNEEKLVVEKPGETVLAGTVPRASRQGGGAE
jgi:hypothetical protein